MTENSNDDYSTWHNDYYGTWNNQLRPDSNDDYGCRILHPSATFTDITFPTVNTDSDSDSSGEDESSKFRSVLGFLQL
jgi:hypothetical protein